jgi:hypothetical protein
VDQPLRPLDLRDGADKVGDASSRWRSHFAPTPSSRGSGRPSMRGQRWGWCVRIPRTFGRGATYTTWTQLRTARSRVFHQQSLDDLTEVT